MKLMTLAMTLGLAATTALANEHLTAITDHAKELQGDYARMAATLKDKKFSPQDLQRDLDQVRSQLEQLKTVAAQFEASAATLTEEQRKEWKATKDVITLLDMFHNRKSEMLSGDNPAKKRKQLRSEAEQNAYRSAILRDRASRLLEVVR